MNKCDICGNVLLNSKGTYMKDWKKIIDKIYSEFYNSPYSCSIRLTGGEPTLHPELYDIVNYIDKKGIEHGLFTTACWDHLNTEDFFSLYSNCQYFSNFLISLQGADADTHALFTKRLESFEETCKYIKLASKENFTILTNTVLTKVSVKQIEQIVLLSESLGASASLFERLFTKDGVLEPSSEELKESLLKIDTLREKRQNCISSMCLPKCFSPNVKGYTKSGFEICTISTLGECRPSNLTSYSFGNILTNDIESIWHSEKALFYRNKIKPQCFSCPELYSCRGGIKHETQEHDIDYDWKMNVVTPSEKYQKEYFLCESDTVIPEFQIIDKGKDLFLASRSVSLPITKSVLPLLLDIYGGKETILNIKSKYGSEGVQLIAYLHEGQYVSFNSYNQEPVMEVQQ
jgi:radical SAM protein with 4Fe4S-binding SPASM domain